MQSAAFSGIAFAFAVYYAHMPSAATLRARFGPLHRVVDRKYYMDEIAEGGLVRGFLYRGVARGLELIDTYVVDMAVNLLGWGMRFGSEIARRTTFGQQQAFLLDDNEFRHLYVPPGFLHGFQALTAIADVCYRIDRPHDPTEDLAVRYDDPDLAITWPLPVTIVSARDASAMTWQQLVARLR